MATVVLGPRWWRAVQRLSRGDRLAVVRAVVVMRLAETLPGPLDAEVVLPPSVAAWRRRAGGTNYWLYYALRADGVALVMRVGGLV